MPASQPGYPELPCAARYVSSPVRYWTVEEARAYLPRLAELVGVIHNAALVQAGAHPSVNGNRSHLRDAQEAYDELSEGDVILRDATQGLVDFHARGADGVVYYLCWKLGEEALEWWHLPSEGFAGRKRLPREPQ